MDLFINSKRKSFQNTPLVFEKRDIEDPFRRYSTKVSKLIQMDEYKKFSSKIKKDYSEYLDKKTGEFVYTLKQKDDNFYLKLLNNYGDKRFCKFKLQNKEDYLKKGLYIYISKSDLMYIGKTVRPYCKRINEYGTISPVNCYLGGQRTNCRLNHFINSNLHVEIQIHPLVDDFLINSYEEKLRKIYNPPWNIR